MTPAISWNIEGEFFLGYRKYIRATGLLILASTVPLGYLVLLLVLPLFFFSSSDNRYWQKLGDETQHLYVVSPMNLLILLGVLVEPRLSRFDQSCSIGYIPGYCTILQYPEM